MGQRDGVRLGGPGDLRREIGETHGFADRPGVVVGSWDDHDVTGTNLIIGAVIPERCGAPETTSIVIGLAGVHPLDQLEGLNTASGLKRRLHEENVLTILRRRSCQVVQ